MAQKKVLTAGHSVVEWAKDNIDADVSLGEDKYIVVNEAFTKYSLWAVSNNYKPSNMNQFGSILTTGILPPGTKSKTIRVGGKVFRVYPRTQWKEEIL